MNIYVYIADSMYTCWQEKLLMISRHTLNLNESITKHNDNKTLSCHCNSYYVIKFIGHHEILRNPSYLQTCLKQNQNKNFNGFTYLNIHDIQDDNKFLSCQFVLSL